jgi:hypothetical protein
MNWKAFIILVIVTAIISVILVTCFTGCAGTGFEKSCTLMPDSFGISVGSYDNENCPDGWPTGWNGVTINATWNLK